MRKEAHVDLMRRRTELELIPQAMLHNFFFLKKKHGSSVLLSSHSSLLSPMGRL